jgi:hypothetical protein
MLRLTDVGYQTTKSAKKWDKVRFSESIQTTKYALSYLVYLASISSSNLYNIIHA